MVEVVIYMLNNTHMYTWSYLSSPAFMATGDTRRLTIHSLKNGSSQLLTCTILKTLDLNVNQNRVRREMWSNPENFT